MGPFLFNGLSMCASDETIEIERESRSAGNPVGWEVELRNQEHDDCAITESHLYRVVIRPFPHMLRPSTRDIV
jgi:hypothetical protein